MQKTIEPTNFNASQELLTHISGLFDSLPKYHDRIVSADIHLTSLRETDTREKEVKLRVHLPGRELFLAKSADTFITAAQSAYDAAKRKLHDLKEQDKRNRQLRPDKVV